VSDCSGGYFPDPLTYYSKIGGVLASTYPYAAGSYGSGTGTPHTPNICTEQKRIFLGNGTVKLYSGQTQSAIQTLLVNYGPIMVGIYANTAFTYYASGVYTGCPSNAASYINHAVVLYGWDTNGNWLIKNQWGTSWGVNGFMTLSSTLDCGISSLLGTIVYTTTNTNVQVTLNPNYTLNTNFTWEDSLGVRIALLLLMILAFI
jgi:hypothetical protein